MGNRQRRRCAGMVAEGEPSLLLVRSRRVAVPLGAASRSGYEAAGRRAAEHPALPQQRAIVEEPAPRRPDDRRRTRQDCLQSWRADWKRLDDGPAARAGLTHQAGTAVIPKATLRIVKGARGDGPSLPRMGARRAKLPLIIRA